MATHSVFLPGESHEQRSLAGYSSWGHRVRRNLAHTLITDYSACQHPGYGHFIHGVSITVSHCRHNISRKIQCESSSHRHESQAK